MLVTESVKSMKQIILKPGQKVPCSGQYEIIDNKGKKTGFEVTLIKGTKTPPTPKSHEKLLLVDITKHKVKSHL